MSQKQIHSNKTNADHPVLWRDSDTVMNDATIGADDKVLHINAKRTDPNRKQKDVKAESHRPERSR